MKHDLESARIHRRRYCLAAILVAAFAVDAHAAGPSGVTEADRLQLEHTGHYNLSKASYDRISDLPAYDNHGTRPVDEGLRLEIEWIDRRLAERASDMRIIEARLPVFIATSKTAEGKAQIVRDMQARKQTYARWQESMIKRRKTIAMQIDGGVERAYPVLVSMPDLEL